MEEKKEKGNFWLTVANFIVNKRKAFLVCLRSPAFTARSA